MSLVTRYFATSSAGAGDGTTWANRAALFSGGNWSSIITGFSFAGADGLECRIGPGTYAITAAFSLAGPTPANPLIFHGADGSGNLLAPPNMGWTADQPVWDETNTPVLATTTNINTITSGVSLARMLKFTATARNGTPVNSVELEWCHIVNSFSGASASAWSGAAIRNCALECTGAVHATIAAFSNRPKGHNLRVSSATGGGIGISVAPTSSDEGEIARACVVGAATGISLATSQTFCAVTVTHCTVVDSVGDGIDCTTTAGTTNGPTVEGCVVTGSGGAGISAGGFSVISGNRLRDNAGGNVTNLGNHVDYDSYTTAATDADDYNDAASGDYRIKATAGFANRGIGVSQMAAAAGSGGTRAYVG